MSLEKKIRANEEDESFSSLDLDDVDAGDRQVDVVSRRGPVQCLVVQRDT